MGKRFIVNQEKESVTLKFDSDCSPRRKHLKQVCEKSIADIEHIRNESQNNKNEIEDMQEIDELKTVESELIKLLPNVISELSNVDKTDGLLNVFKIVYEKRFPLDNIAFELFLDVVKWFSVSSTTLMRYNQTSKVFWRLGYVLFHGRFLRFMSGFKSIGSIINGESSRGQYSPVNSRIYFAVPDISNLRSNNDNKQTYTITTVIN